MKIIIENTSKLVNINGVPSRIWEGRTESGIPIHCFITRIAVEKDEPRIAEFDSELQEVKAPSAEIQAYPLNLIL